MIDSIEYLSLDKALQFVPVKPTVAISILPLGREPATLHAEIDPVLRLHFEDTANGATISDVGMFTRAQACQVIDFLRAHHEHPEPRHLLIHCEAGISGSAAVAVFAAREYRIPLTGQLTSLNSWVLGMLMLVKAAYPHYAS